jgi:hypothetical protein
MSLNLSALRSIQVRRRGSGQPGGVYVSRSTMMYALFGRQTGANRILRQSG